MQSWQTSVVLLDLLQLGGTFNVFFFFWIFTNQNLGEDDTQFEFYHMCETGWNKPPILVQVVFFWGWEKALLSWDTLSETNSQRPWK